MSEMSDLLEEDFKQAPQLPKQSLLELLNLMKELFNNSMNFIQHLEKKVDVNRHHEYSAQKIKEECNQVKKDKDQAVRSMEQEIL